MKILFNIISIVIMVSVISLTALNTQTAVDFALWGSNKLHLAIYHATLGNTILIFFVAGILAGIFWAASFYSSTQGKLKEYQRKLEKTSVQSSEDSSKVEVLEAKIQTLEKALQSALEKNND